MTSVPAGHIILTPTQPVPPHQESRALPTELPTHTQKKKKKKKLT